VLHWGKHKKRSACAAAGAGNAPTGKRSKHSSSNAEGTELHMPAAAAVTSTAAAAVAGKFTVKALAQTLKVTAAAVFTRRGCS
jgi:hypothetical protein